VPRYFLDTSALAKVYRKELGSDLMDRIVAEPGSHRFISRFTILEMESVLALKFRTGEIDERSILIARRRLEADRRPRRLLVATDGCYSDRRSCKHPQTDSSSRAGKVYKKKAR
jgi:hypothetical protein